MSTILLIRHGESKSNVGLPTARPKNVALTDLGIEQAECIACFLAYKGPLDFIVTSSYQRTKQTAALTKLRFPQIHEEEWQVHEFTYLSEEEFRGPSSVEDRKPLKDMYWEMCDPKFIDGPGAESFEQFIERVRGVIKRFENLADDGTVAIFSHEQFICAIYWLLKRKPERLTCEEMRDFKDFLTEHSIPNGGFLRLQRTDAQYPWQCESILPLVAV